MTADRTILTLRTYLDSIGIQGYTVHTAEGGDEFLLIVDVPRENGERIGILKGRNGRNLSVLKSILRIVGLTEQVNLCLVIKLTT